MKLFKVRITRWICVNADNDQDAKALAYKNKDVDDCEEDDFYAAAEIANIEDIPSNWRDCVPYGNSMLTIEEQLAQKALSTKGG